MVTYLLMSLNRTWRAVALVMLALLILPSVALAVSMSDIVEMFKYSYGVTDMIYLGSLEVVLWNLIKKSKKAVRGRGQAIIPYQKRLAGVFGGITESSTLTSLRAQPKSYEATFALKEFAAVWDISWKTLRNATKGKDAFISALDFMDKSVSRRVFKVINAQLCSFTGLGELAILPDADNDTTITVNSLPFMDQGMYVDLIDASDYITEICSDRVVEGIDVEGRTVSISGAAAAGTAASDFFVPSGQVQGGAHLSLLGMGAWINDANPPAVVGNIGGVNRSTLGNESYKGNVMDNGGTLRPFTEDLLLSGENLMRERGGKQADRYAANGNILKKYHRDLIVDKYFAYNKIQSVGAGGEKVGFGREGMDLEGGENGTGKTPYTLSGKPFHCEPYLRANRILGWCDDNFWIGHDGIEVPTPLSEIFDDMVSYFHFAGTSPKFDVWHYWEAELLSDDPQAGIQFADLSES